jgi:putative transposase
VRCFTEDFAACIAHLHCPPAHRRATRTTNLLERLFEDGRRREKVTPAVAGERPVLKLMYASLIRASDTWRGLRITDLERRQLERLQEQLLDETRRANAPALHNCSTPRQIYCKDGT